MKENISNLVNEIDLQVQEEQRVLIKLEPKRSTPRHITVKMPKVKDQESILKAARVESYLQRSSHKTVS